MGKIFLKSDPLSEYPLHCQCGNTPAYEGFVPYNAGDDESRHDWQEFVLCNRCGRIMDRDTLKVIGQKPVDESDSEF